MTSHHHRPLPFTSAGDANAAILEALLVPLGVRGLVGLTTEARAALQAASDAGDVDAITAHLVAAHKVHVACCSKGGECVWER